ncbi:MAG: DEAD/DEAH box helicase family protein [Pontiellaceae bacterium]|nr:DEAD/DEAH box helicase family protein [Pontiellaceae bacterium]
MKSFPNHLKFKYPWRSYQKRVLDELDHHLDDHKLHVIAPPGSGKTILGLEVLLRLNTPTLILAPTLTIRNQWIDRLYELFLPEDAPRPDWISTDIRDPKKLTVVTYHALHSVISGKSKQEEDPEEENETQQTDHCAEKIDCKNLIEKYQTLKLGTLVADECHHLKNEWWRSLTYFVEKFPALTTVSLTATPPYDVGPAEWERYENFCGPVDAEISVPELVRRSDLCPHQDFVMLSVPEGTEKQILNDFHLGVNQFCEAIVRDHEFAAIVFQHRFIADTENCVSEILEAPSYYSSMLIYLKAAGAELSEKLFKLLAVYPNETPALSKSWIEVLLTGLLYKEEWSDSAQESKVAELKRNLKRIGAVERRKITLTSNTALYGLLSQSSAKLSSMEIISSLEYAAMGNNLRMVILSDFIRKSYIPKPESALEQKFKLGVVPIFEHLRSQRPTEAKLGILTGSLVVIPQPALPYFQLACTEIRTPATQLKTTPWPNDPDYIIIENFGESRSKIVKVVTEIFEAGHINVLIGTKSLLGEGWDSPSINSLILASFVGSFVLSNQMRGRAIRHQPENNEKVSNIWHLACIDPDSPTGGDDLKMLTRRFNTFLGLSNFDFSIERGFARLDLGSPPFDSETVLAINDKMKALAQDRRGTRIKWMDSLGNGTRLVEVVKTPRHLVPKEFVFNKTIRALLIQGLLGAGMFVSEALQSLRVRRDPEQQWTIFKMIFIIGFLLAIPTSIRCLWLVLKNGPVEAAARQIAQALLETLIHLNIIKTDRRELNLIVEHDKHGFVHCFLDGATYFESSLFRNALQEILGPINNPRYLITRKSECMAFQRDYHSVPTIFGQKKEDALCFADFWNKLVGKNRLIYTRTPEGRKSLIQARGFALSTEFAEKSEIISKWQ